MKKFIFILFIALISAEAASALPCVNNGNSCDQLSVGTACGVGNRPGVCISTNTYNDGFADCACRSNGNGAISTGPSLTACTYSSNSCDQLTVGMACSRGDRIGVCLSTNTYDSLNADCGCF